MSKEITENIKLLIVLFVAVVIILALIGASNREISFVSSFFVSAIVGAMFSLAASSLRPLARTKSEKCRFL